MRDPLLADENKQGIQQALRLFTEWLGGTTNVAVWGNGAKFDLSILEAAYMTVPMFGLGVGVPWNFRKEYCYRTLKNLRPECQVTRRGTAHNALDDAINQAAHAIQLLKELGVW